MASKGPRSKLDHETRARRQKALEAPREPPRLKAHWDHVLEEMVWLSKDFEAERKWKLAQAKKVAIRASKSILEYATRGDKKVKEEEQRLRKVALNISKDVKKFWIKIEKLVLYKHQLELEERKKKVLDKQLDFLLGQTERYSTRLAENLVDMPSTIQPPNVDTRIGRPNNAKREADESGLIERNKDSVVQLDDMEIDDDYGIHSEDVVDDDENTIEEDEAHITDAERSEELAGLQVEADLPLEELLKKYTNDNVSRESCLQNGEDVSASTMKRKEKINDFSNLVNGSDHTIRSPEKKFPSEGRHSSPTVIENISSVNDSPPYYREYNDGDDPSCQDGHLILRSRRLKRQSKDFCIPKEESSLFASADERDDGDYILAAEEEKDDETTLAEEEELAKEDTSGPLDEIDLLWQESGIPIEELLARYKKEVDIDDGTDESESESVSASDDQSDSTEHVLYKDPTLTMDNTTFKEGLPAELKEVDPVFEETLRDNMAIDKRESENVIADAAAAARSAQPTGNTFSTTKVRTKFPFLLKHPLREYQHIGLDWLVTMYEQRLNGILADEMGLGKTIMTISLLAHLACEKGIWGPHLIVVPTSVMLNWETEFLKWCPAFKILTYFGSAKERKHKRQGWLKPNAFHICITTYRLVIQDSKVFKRKKWKYLILDEAHLIKNWKSQRWQTLLNFNSKRRILLTGTPLQNDLMELWSLMHFLMPHIFQSHQEFKGWFSNPISGMVEGQEKVNREVLDRLHNVLRPFILRRLKRDVEKQLPKKYEHIIYCRLSKRQRNLYEDFIDSSETQATLASSNFFGMISVIMQLRKVCNHPDLFEGRPIISSFDMASIDLQLSSAVCTMLSCGPFSQVDLIGLNLVFTHLDYNMTSWEIEEVALNACSLNSIEDKMLMVSDGVQLPSSISDRRRIHGTNIFEEIQRSIFEERWRQLKERAASIAWWNSVRCQKKPVYGTNLREIVTIKHPVSDIYEQKNNPSRYMEFSSRLGDIILSPVERLQEMLDLVECFMFAIPASRTPPPVCWCSKSGSPVLLQLAYTEKCTEVFSPLLSPIRPVIVRRQVYFPDRRLIQFDCGKLQELSILLRRLKSEGHRALIFTQMTKMLDVLEAFINLYGYTYMRLDGSTPPEERQTLMQRFNTNPKFFLFILSTRSGGVGINLVGADTVIFYDSDWNPAMDLQAQDRCHRIGQTREVHIYRLISESTIEENILKKANQKRLLDDLVIQGGSYNTDFFKKLDPVELFSGHGALPVDKVHDKSSTPIGCSKNTMTVLSNADVEAAIKQAEDEADYMALKKVEQEEAVDNQEFTEEVTGKLDDDEYVNEDDMKPDEKVTEEQNCWKSTANNDNEATCSGDNVDEEKALTLVEGDEDIDMLADVKQMAAAAAAAGQASSSFENQLRPIDRYAMRFLDIWDPVVDKSAEELPANVVEEEWELDRIEKFKEDLEAEIDEDQEPFLYEKWDADFATKAYRQHVEALAQRQLLEEQECEGQDTDNANTSDEAIRNETTTERKPKSKTKSKKKQKKTKFKSLKKGHLASELDVSHERSRTGPISVDEKVLSPEVMCIESPSRSPPKKKRKKVLMTPEDGKNSRSSKKQKKAPDGKAIADSNSKVKQLVESRDSKPGEGVNDLDGKPTNRSKTRGKISITVMPIKRVMVVKPERLKKRRDVWSKDCFPPSDSWSSQEDAMLCAIIHEYGTNWTLVSDTLYSMPGGGFYRGWFRHPIHCCERFRELFLKYVHPTTDSSNTEKITMPGSGKALFKVTEDHVRKLLNVACELPDNESHIQKHFMAILSSSWRAKWRLEQSRNMTSSQNMFSPRSLTRHSRERTSRRLLENMDLATTRQSSKLVLAALGNAGGKHQQEPRAVHDQLVNRSFDQVDITLEFPTGNTDCGHPFPSSIDVSIFLPEPPLQAEEYREQTLLAESSCRLAENRLRAASEACLEGEGSGWASSAFPSCDVVRHRSGGKPPSLGKHKAASDSTRPQKSKLLRTAEPNDASCSVNKSILPSPRPPPMEFNDLPSVLYTDSECYPPHLLDVGPSFVEITDDAGHIPLEFDPNFLTDFDDLGSLSDITDFG